jgi:periplasmic copper chaperone A
MDTGRRWQAMEAMGMSERWLAMTARIVGMSLLASAVLLQACGSGEGAGGGGVVVEDAWARPMAVPEDGPSPPGIHSAAYMILRNDGGSPDRLVGGEISGAESLEIHESRMEDGIMRMRRVSGGIPVAPGERVELRPGGLHLMLMNLGASLVEGDTLVLSLHFEVSGHQEVLVPVRAAGSR